MAIYRLTVGLKFPGGTTVGSNTWHIRSTSVPILGTPGIVGAIHTFYSSIGSLFGSTYFWTFDGVLTEVGTASPGIVSPVTSWSVQGSAGGGTESGPSGVGLVVGWRSSLATRRGRGRTFIAPLPTAQFQNDGTIADAFLASVRNAAAALVATSVADGNGAVGVYSSTDDGGSTAPLGTLRDIVAYKVNDKVAYLSSRRG